MRISTNQIKFSELYAEAFESKRTKMKMMRVKKERKMKITNGKDKFKEKCRSFSYKDFFVLLLLLLPPPFQRSNIFFFFLYFVSFCVCVCVCGASSSSHWTYFFFIFFHHIERNCKIFLFRFYLNVAFGILSLTKEIPSENKIFSVTFLFYNRYRVVCSINLNDR